MTRHFILLLAICAVIGVGLFRSEERAPPTISSPIPSSQHSKAPAPLEENDPFFTQSELTFHSREAGPPARIPPNAPATWMDCSFKNGKLNCGECVSDTECPEGQACIRNGTTRKNYCLRNTCEEDQECPTGFRCEQLNDGISGPPVKGCVPIGIKAEGETCSFQRKEYAESCQAGLICAGGICRRSCPADPDVQCPEGQVCSDSGEGLACRPSGCNHVVCDLGYICNQGFCIKGDDCNKTGCPQGQSCIVAGYGQKYVTECLYKCQDGQCPNDLLCGIQNICYPPCDSSNPDSCPAGKICTTINEEMTQWGCQARFHE